MSKKKGKKAVPLMLFWSRQEQRRFCEAVERFHALVNDLESLLAAPKRRAELAAATRRARIAAEEARQEQARLNAQAGDNAQAPPPVDGQGDPIPPFVPELEVSDR